MTTTLANATWITPFGAPFDTAVIAGIVLTVLAIALSGLGRRANAQGKEEQ